ncbi:MAG: hypothetical protein ABJN04_02325 [Hyphomicrobiales bacterium]
MKDFEERLKAAKAKHTAKDDDSHQVEELSRPPLPRLGSFTVLALLIGFLLLMVGGGLWVAGIEIGKTIATLGLIVLGAFLFLFQYGSKSFSERIFGKADLPTEENDKK